MQYTEIFLGVKIENFDRFFLLIFLIFVLKTLIVGTRYNSLCFG